MTKRNVGFTATLVAALFAAGCAAPGSDLIVDGPRSYAYETDLAACRNIAAQRQAKLGSTLAGAAIGGLAGAADSDKGDEAEDALVGAAVGAVVGRGAAEVEVRKQRETIVFNCMKGRGYKVVG